MDPNTASREEFTNHLLHKEIPANATNEWVGQASNLKQLLSLLAFDEAMEPNLQQVYMIPAQSKNKIYFMWDFVGRTLGMLYSIPPNAPLSSSRYQEAYSDLVGRSVMAAELLLDSKPGMLDMMVESTYPNQTGGRPSISEDIKAAARKLPSRRD